MHPSTYEHEKQKLELNKIQINDSQHSIYICQKLSSTEDMKLSLPYPLSFPYIPLQTDDAKTEHKAYLHIHQNASVASTVTLEKATAFINNTFGFCPLPSSFYLTVCLPLRSNTPHFHNLHSTVQLLQLG